MLTPKEITHLFKKAKLCTQEANVEILKFLERSNNFDLSGKHGEVALHWAAFYGNIDLIETLVQKGGFINIQDEANQRTPMIWAALRILHDVDKYSKVINTLEKLGADPSIRDHHKNNVMEILKSLEEINKKLNFSSKFSPEDDSQQDAVLLYQPQPILSIDKNDNSAFALHGDDSSDEEITDCSQYDIKQSWEQFKKECRI